MESDRSRSQDIRNTHLCLDHDPRRNLPTSSRVPVRWVVVHSGPGRVGTQSGDNYLAGRYLDVPPSSPYVLKSLSLNLDGRLVRSSSGLIMMSDSLQSIQKPCLPKLPGDMSTQHIILPCFFSIICLTGSTDSEIMAPSP